MAVVGVAVSKWLARVETWLPTPVEMHDFTNSDEQ